MPKIAPSILAADFSRLGELIHKVEAGGADRLHIDVMDGHFVPNLSMGPVVVQSLRPITKLPLEVHLMVSEPPKFVDAFRKAGADTIIFHLEVVRDPRHLIDHIHALGARVGLAINPGTHVDFLAPHLLEIDLALCMTVWPGFGGQQFLPESLGRIAALRALIDQVNPACELEVDGGIITETARDSVQAGASVLVAGTSIFGSPFGSKEATRAMMNMAFTEN